MLINRNYDNPRTTFKELVKNNEQIFTLDILYSQK